MGTSTIELEEAQKSVGELYTALLKFFGNELTNPAPVPWSELSLGQQAKFSLVLATSDFPLIVSDAFRVTL